MKTYWLRVLGAWLLMQFASRLMKDAESLVHHTAKGENAHE